MRRLVLCVFALIAATGAAYAGGTEAVSRAPSSFANCAEAAAYYSGLAGRKLEEPVPFAPHRMLTPTSVVTMDYNPLRLNVYVDEAGVVLKAACG